MLRILATIHTMPDVTSYKTKIFQNILPILRSKTDVHVIWLVYMPERVNLSIEKDPNTTILDIHDYKNALEIIQRAKPDIIYGSPTINLPDYALTLVGKFLNIPVVGEVQNRTFEKHSVVETIRSFTKAFFENSLPMDTPEKKKIMKRGRFFLYKYLFLLRTQKAIKMNILRILESFLVIIRVHLSAFKTAYHPYFACTLNFVESEPLLELLVRRGFKRSSLIVTGIPHYDPAFKRLQNIHVTSRKDGKIRILLLTHSMLEHGYQTRTQRDSLVKGIVTEIFKHKEEMSLTVKIHPSSENLSDYQVLINSIDPSIPIYQTGDVLDFIVESDVIIAYSTSSSIIQALILNKPVIICNLFNLEKDIILERELAYNCKELSSLISTIKEALTSNPITKQKINEFIRHFLYKSDGLASVRVCDAIFRC